MYSSIDTYAAARKEIDEQIAQLTEQIISLKTKRNTLAPVACLHMDIIQEIFLFASHGSKSRRAGRTALLLTAVCRGWRNLAHQTSALWAFIDFTNLTWMEVAVSRTKNRPLNFDLYFPLKKENDMESSLSFTLRCLPRMSVLKIDDILRESGQPRMRPHPLWLIPAPRLVELDLRGISIPSYTSNLFPALQRLILDKCSFDWNHLPIHTGLQSLTITSPYEPTRALVNELLPMLHVLAPEVENLDFHHCLRRIEDHPPEQRLLPQDLLHVEPSRLEFPKLKSFIFREEDASCVALVLNRISLTPRVDHISVESDDDIDLQSMNLLQAFVSCRGSGEWPIESLDLRLDYDSIRFTFFEDALEDFGEAKQEDDESGCGTTTKSITLGLKIVTKIRDLLPVFGILPPLPIHNLTLSGTYTDGYISSLLARIDPNRSIEVLNVTSHSVPGFTKTFEKQKRMVRRITGCDRPEAIPQRGLDGTKTTECLKVFSLSGLTKVRYYVKPDEDKPFVSEADIKALREWLHWRRSLGVGVEEVVFDRVDIYSESKVKALFEGVVDRFECIEVVSSGKRVEVENVPMPSLSSSGWGIEQEVNEACEWWNNEEDSALDHFISGRH